MDQNAALADILAGLQQKYREFNKLMDATREMEQVSFDDEASFSVLLQTRKNSMDNVDQIDEKIKKAFAELSEEAFARVTVLLSPDGEAGSAKTPLEEEIFNAGKQNMLLLRQIIDLDEKLSKALKDRIGD